MGGEPTQKLRKQIEVPDGWRVGSVNRDFLDAAAFERGFQLLATYQVPNNYVAEVTRVEAGVFAALALPGGQISQIDQHHWWSLNSDQHAVVGAPPPVPAPEWNLYLVESAGTPNTQDNPLPADGTVIANPNGQNPPLGNFDQIWPALRFGLISFAAHKTIIGPRLVGLVAAWEQPPAGTLVWGFAQSWGLMEGRTLRYDSPEARRLVLGGLT